MTRKRLYLYHVTGFASVCLTLYLVAPPLLPEVVGFSAVYLALLLVALLVGWAVRTRSGLIRGIGASFMVCACFVTLGLLGGPGWGILAGVLAIVTYWPRRVRV